MPKLDPDEIHWTEEATALSGVKLFRRMTDDEIERFNESKTGKTKVQPVTDPKVIPEQLT